jgi:acetyl-CoA C-acetyltransferase
LPTVTGAYLTDYNRRKDGSSFRDWAVESFNAALMMSDVECADIDLLVVASESDFFTLQLNPASVLAADLGLHGAPTMRVEGGGASGQLAVHVAVQAILSGTARQAAVIGVDPSASGLPPASVKQLYGFSFDAFSDGITGVSATALYALSAQIFMAENGITDDDLAAVTIANRANALANPKAHLGREHDLTEFEDSPMIASPYRRLHCSPLSDGAAALILSADNYVPASRKAAARIVAIGGASDHPRLSARACPGNFSAKQNAMQKACNMAGITPADIGLAEVYDSYAGAQLQAIDALGLSPGNVRGKGAGLSASLRDGVFGADGQMPINLSGGLMGQGAPAGAIGVGQTANCALFLEGRHHSGLQPANPPRMALADTHGGVGTTAAITLLAQSGGGAFGVC